MLQRVSKTALKSHGVCCENDFARLSAYLLNRSIQRGTQRLPSEMVPIHLSNSLQMEAKCTLRSREVRDEKKAKIEAAKR